MALFTSKEDASVPFLTRIAQVDINSPVEIAEFLRNEAIVLDTDQEDVIEACLLARRVLSSLATYGTIHWGDVRFVQSCQMTRHFGIQDDPIEIADESRIPVTALKMGWSRTADVGNVTGWTCTFIVDLLAQIAQSGTHRVTVCLECGWAFPGVKPNQKFCSSRCSHRNGERHRYAIRYDLTPEKRNSGSEKKFPDPEGAKEGVRDK